MNCSVWLKLAFYEANTTVVGLDDPDEPAGKLSGLEVDCAGATELYIY